MTASPRWAGVRLFVLLLGLSGCGSPASEPAPMADGTSAGGATAAASKSTEAAAPEQERPAPTQTSGRGTDALPSPTQPGTLLTESSRGIPPAPEARAPSPASADRQQLDERAAAEQAQWQAWYAAAREHPDVSVRLQALDHWAQQPGESLDPVTYALVDGDEDVRARAQDVWAQQLTREAAAAGPVQAEGDRGQTAR